MTDAISPLSPTPSSSNNAVANSPARVLIASLIGTTIEFFDFYVYATAAVIVFPKLFFPASDPTSATLQSFATFSIAFFARPIGAMIFGHFGDRIGRKATLVAALMTMGLSTVVIGMLPTYESIGVLAPILLALCRLGQGLGLGGEWGGAVLLATENAPEGKRSWYAMFPQLGAPIGFILSAGLFLILRETMADADFLNYGWRVPFLISIVLVAVGLYVRLKITETPEFQRAIEKEERVSVPIAVIFRSHFRSLILGTIIAVATFVLFYLMTAFTLSWGTRAPGNGPLPAGLGYSQGQFLVVQLVGVVFFGLMIPVSGLLSDRYSRRLVLILTTIGILIFGLSYSSLLTAGLAGAFACSIIGLALMGFTYGPIGAALAAPFPTTVRYTGASMTFNLGGIVGASLAPYIATSLATNYGLVYVGYYLAGAAVLSLIGILLSGNDEV
ncbi:MULTISPECIES: MFS transporter [Rhizobium]|uniref:MHS family MFS transporter n=1 Tax=Rhizobium tropici TaxID=398 RepID=A0A6P1C1H2_RHITR|nr:MULTISPECIES: MFS transporter [Rhizobium]AGB71650.1 major facilitator superfamily (MFS) transporter [Rhizobium tropici CIAT 899]MBB4239988.1 metabolite-proton symporter [Rhizobium tropici]MBB5591258.1 metabolite-proton symporter [Rhizobium tropici]MBB6490658.1 metabolite-proton symporter [Rhizobium tropici]NEV10301.1 MHS family MFS transporter [Rhizobium tropici]